METLELTNTITITTKHEVESTKEITLPYYSKNGVSAYKVIDKDNVIQVAYWGTFKGITKSVTDIAFHNTEQCTENEFDKLYSEVLDQILVSM